MRKRIAIVIAGLLVLAGVMAATGLTSASATRSAEGLQLDGTWMVTVTRINPPPGLAPTFNARGRPYGAAVRGRGFVHGGGRRPTIRCRRQSRGRTVARNRGRHAAGHQPQPGSAVGVRKRWDRRKLNAQVRTTWRGCGGYRRRTRIRLRRRRCWPSLL